MRKLEIKINRLDIIQLLISAFLLTITGLMNTHLKEEPQIYMMLIGITAVVLSYLNQDRLFNILFFIVLGIILYINIFTITNWIIDIINPHHGTLKVNGVKRRFMDLSGLWGVFFGLIFTPILLTIYNRSGIRNKKIETIVVGTFSILSIIIYALCEF